MIPLAYGLCIVVLGLLAWEAVLVRRHVDRLPLRVHVNGTRGKSSVTRYVAAGLRASGKRTAGKITGVIPTFLLPCGGRRQIRRRGPARVQEQMRIIRRASRLSVDALVLECMSVAPELQKLEARVFRPHFTAIPNIRDDHQEHMGLSEKEQAAAIVSAIAPATVVVTTEREHLDVIRAAAAAVSATVVFVDREDYPLPANLSAGVFPDNLALACKICELAGAERETALAAILREATRATDGELLLSINDCSVRFADGFAVNDVPSALAFLAQHRKEGEEIFVVLNTRCDRPYRTQAFCRWLCMLDKIRMVSAVVLTGTHVPLARAALVKQGMPSQSIRLLSRKEARDPGLFLRSMVTRDTLLVGLGNIAGDGFTFVESIRRVAAREQKT